MKKYATLLAILFVFTFGMIGCSNDSSSKATKSNQSKVEKVTIEITTDSGKKVIAKKEVGINKENLYNLMKNNFKIKDDKGFITDIEGVSQNKEKNLYWVFEINGKQISKGAQDVIPKKGDKIVWKLNDFS